MEISSHAAVQRSSLRDRHAERDEVAHEPVGVGSEERLVEAVQRVRFGIELALILAIGRRFRERNDFEERRLLIVARVHLHRDGLRQ